MNVALSLVCSGLIVITAYFINVWFAARWREVMRTDFSALGALLFEGIVLVIFGLVVLLGTMAPFNYDHLKRVGWWGGIWWAGPTRTDQSVPRIGLIAFLSGLLMILVYFASL